MENIIIYQALVRLFGNQSTTRKTNGGIDTNGCGKFNDFSPKALKAIKKLGANYLWYTGILEHATTTTYSDIEIQADPASITKGKAGSPYAVRDYYDVDPDLALEPKQRIQEFESLIIRTHKAGLKAIIDFIPNHVARTYHSDIKPDGIEDFGSNDIKEHHFNPQNNFYYFPNDTLQPQFECSDYHEFPAKATGNNVFNAYPGINDWYEAIKLNYGKDYTGNQQVHKKPIPDTWHKMLHILTYWAAKGVDGFRCDMAEMVPVDFWHWVIPQIKQQYPHIIFIAEVYNPKLYRSYIQYGCFDYLYDKVDLYDTLRNVICQQESASAITGCWQRNNDIKEHMLNFLENHDEQRIASDFFVKEPHKAFPAWIVSCLLSPCPTMLYMGQEIGERGMDQEGFSGIDGRTSIFDYWSLESLQRLSNNQKYDGKSLLENEKYIFKFYQKILQIRNKEKVFNNGTLYDLQWLNYNNPYYDSDKYYAWFRHNEDSIVLIIVNFSDTNQPIKLNLSEHVFEYLNIQNNCDQKCTELLSGNKVTIKLNAQSPTVLEVPAHNGIILKFK